MLITLLAFIVVLGITITVHEFGHFAMAKLLKIRVLVFSLGFGPKLIGFTRGDTEYRLSPFPIGGYVKMAGEAYEDHQGTPDEFLSHPKSHRFLVAIAGPMMNILLAVFILTASYMQGVSVPRYPKEPAIVGPVAANSPARLAGLKTGDRIITVNGNPVSTWEDMEVALGTAPRDALNVEVSRNNEVVRIHFDAPSKEKTIGYESLGFKFPLSRTIVYLVDGNTPAYKAGLKEGDEILSVRKGDEIGRNYNEILNIISESEGVPLSLRFADRMPRSIETTCGRPPHLRMTVFTISQSLQSKKTGASLWDLVRIILRICSNMGSSGRLPNRFIVTTNYPPSLSGLLEEL